MNYGETSAALRRIPVYLVDDAGDAVSVTAPTGSQLMVSRSGAAWQNAAGTWIEVDAAQGQYAYEATLDEATTPSFLLLRVAHPDASVFLFNEDIGDRVPSNAAANERYIAVYLTNADGSGDPVTGLTGDIEPQLSIAGGAFFNVDDVSPTEIGLGAYYVALSATEVRVPGPRVLRILTGSTMPFVYRFDVRDPVDADEADVPDSTPAPIVLDDQVAHDHAEHAVNRLCQYARFRSED